MFALKIDVIKNVCVRWKQIASDKDFYYLLESYNIKGMINTARARVRIYPTLKGILMGCEFVLSNIRRFQTVPRLPLILSARDDDLRVALDF